MNQCRFKKQIKWDDYFKSKTGKITRESYKIEWCDSAGKLKS